MHRISGAEESTAYSSLFFPVFLPREGLPQSAVGLCWMLLASEDVDLSLSEC